MLLVLVSGSAIVTVSWAVAVCAGLPESVTVNVMAAPTTATVGKPASVAFDAFSDSPAGRGPLDQLYGAVPPEALSVAEYGLPVCPTGSALVVSFRVAGGGGGGGEGGSEFEPPPQPWSSSTPMTIEGRNSSREQRESAN
ncbi:MAG: hypothetical protein PVS2B3_08740 [Steroidobacteraceae bacterium]